MLVKRTYSRLSHCRFGCAGEYHGHSRRPLLPAMLPHLEFTGFKSHLVKATIAILLVTWVATGCEKHPFLSLHGDNQNKVIALQPFGNFGGEELAFIRKEVSALFYTPVIILKPVNLPVTYRATGEDSYSADSIIVFLSKFANDTIADVIGLMHSDIYTIHEYKGYHDNVPVVLYEPRGVFGYGYVSGNSCVVSDYRLMAKDQELVNNRVTKVIIHEIGHNLGLQHCATDSCVMFEGDISALDKCRGNFCNKCSWLLN